MTFREIYIYIYIITPVIYTVIIIDKMLVKLKFAFKVSTCIFKLFILYLQDQEPCSEIWGQMSPTFGPPSSVSITLYNIPQQLPVLGQWLTDYMESLP